MKSLNIVIGACLIALAPLVILSCTVYTLMLPSVFESTAKVAIRPSAGCESPCGHCAYAEPAFIRTELEVIQSKPILYETIKRMELQREWGRGNGLLPREVTYKILRNSLAVSHVRSSYVVNLSVRRDAPDEAADIANELAAVYKDLQKHRAKNGEKSVAMQIIDIAEPNRRSVSPNLFINILISLAIAGAISVAGGIMLIIGLKAKKPTPQME